MDLIIKDTKADFNEYFDICNASDETKEKFETKDFLVVPSKYQDKEYYFAQETIDFIKYCRLNDAEHTYDVLADGDISVRSLHSFDIWMPVIWVASNILLPFAINMVCNYIAEKRKGREKEETQVDVTFIVKSKEKEKSLHYKGDAVAFKESFEKIDLNDM